MGFTELVNQHQRSKRKKNQKNKRAKSNDRFRISQMAKKSGDISTGGCGICEM